jgi:hypothetical protein
MMYAFVYMMYAYNRHNMHTPATTFSEALPAPSAIAILQKQSIAAGQGKIDTAGSKRKSPEPENESEDAEKEANEEKEAEEEEEDKSTEEESKEESKEEKEEPVEASQMEEDK